MARLQAALRPSRVAGASQVAGASRVAREGRLPSYSSGSYWRALSEPSGPLKDPFDQGTMTLLSADRAEYASDSGLTVLLERLDERPSFIPCR